MKECKKCHQLKPLSEFYKHPKTKDGRGGTCKKCINARERERYHLFGKIEEISSIINGYKIFILNYTKKGESKFNILKTETGEVFKTNDREIFINYLRGNI